MTEPSPWLPNGFLHAAGPVAVAQAEHFAFIAGVMTLIVLPLFIGLPIVLWRYRRGGRGAYRPDWDSSRLLEALVWGAPVVAVVVLGAKMLSHTLEFDPYRPLGPDPLVVEVVSLDWKFLFLYPEQGVAAVDLLVLPTDRPVTLKLTSGTVMQSFIVPQLAGQVYMMAGMTTQLNLSASLAGTYVGRNTQYNGSGFATQSFETRAVAEEDFEAWAAQAGAQGETLDWSAYQSLAMPSVVDAPVLYAAFEAGMFDRVVASFSGGAAHGAAYGHMHGHGAGGMSAAGGARETGGEAAEAGR